MEIILNTAIKPFNFSFYTRGGLKTVQLPPGAVRVPKEYIESLRNIPMFATLEEDNVLAVGVKGSDKTPKAREIGKGGETKGKETKPVKDALVVEQAKNAKGKKVDKVTKAASLMDLEDL